MTTASAAGHAHPPIITVTLNPALDLSTDTPELLPSHKLRCAAALRHPGGGGINVARVLHRFGDPVCALYLAGGLTGEQLERLLSDEGVVGHRVAIAGETRTSFAVVETDTGREYRFVLPGPTVRPDEWQAACAALASLVAQGGLVVLSGSLPPGVPMDGWAQLARIAADRGGRVVLDSSGPALAATLTAGSGVSLVKPSLRELGDLLGRPLDDEAQWHAASRELIASGRAQRVALSLGERGAMLTTPEGCWRADALAVPVASSTGAGDSFLAALCSAWLQVGCAAQALRWAVAAGSAALLQAGTALCRPEDVARLAPLVQLRAIGTGPPARPSDGARL